MGEYETASLYYQGVINQIQRPFFNSHGSTNKWVLAAGEQDGPEKHEFVTVPAHVRTMVITMFTMLIPWCTILTVFWSHNKYAPWRDMLCSWMCCWITCVSSTHRHLAVHIAALSASQYQRLFMKFSSVVPSLKKWDRKRRLIDWLIRVNCSV